MNTLNMQHTSKIGRRDKGISYRPHTWKRGEMEMVGMIVSSAKLMFALQKFPRQQQKNRFLLSIISSSTQVAAKGERLAKRLAHGLTCYSHHLMTTLLAQIICDLKHTYNNFLEVVNYCHGQNLKITDY